MPLSGAWKSRLGFAAARAVKLAARARAMPSRPLDATERAAAAPVFGGSVRLERVRVHAPASGLVAVSRRAFVIEDAIYVPAPFLPLSLTVLVHELVHVWQHQNGGHAYIADSVQAQLWGEGYALERAFFERRAWSALNCEQQATLIEEAFAQGYFQGGPVKLSGQSATAWVEAAVRELQAGRGAGFG